VFLKHNKRVVCRESISGDPKSRRIYNGNSNYVTTLILNEKQDMFFALEGNNGFGNIVQYSVSSGRVIKNFKNMLLSEIYAGALLGNWLFFGGITNMIGVLNIRTQELFPNYLETAIEYMYSVDAVQSLNKKKAFLIVGGYYQDYSQTKTDLFDISTMIGDVQ
jgi:hypothetical protein